MGGSRQSKFQFECTTGPAYENWIPTADDGKGATFKATQVVFRRVAVKDGILNVNIVDLGPGDPPENAAIKAMAILQDGTVAGVGAPRISPVRRVEGTLAIPVDPNPNLALFQAGLADLELQESTDLVRWSPSPVLPQVEEGRVVFEPPTQSGRQFYRVVARSLSQ